MDTLISMTKKESQRYDIIRSLQKGEITIQQASLQMGITPRHTKRLKKRVKKEGMQALGHALRGKKSNHMLDEKVKEKAIKILKEKYGDFGPTLATEKLEEKENVHLHVSTVRSIMIQERLFIPKKRKRESPQYRSWRPRKEYFGEMQQFDGSYHDWFEGRGKEKEQCLLASIDDATGHITQAVFTKNEGVKNVFRFWKKYIQEKSQKCRRQS